jgi:hypothetical protein
MVAMLKSVDWRDLRNYGQLHPALAARIATAATWTITGRTDNPLEYGVGDNLADLVLLDVTRAVLLWLTDPTDGELIDGVHAAARACAGIGDLLDELGQ